jgi:hypothetical protein
MRIRLEIRHPVVAEDDRLVGAAKPEPAEHAPKVSSHAHRVTLPNPTASGMFPETTSRH